MVAATVGSLRPAVPSHAAEQPPAARMKASSKVFWPVARITAPRSGGLLSSGITYAAAPYQPRLTAADASCACMATDAPAPSATATLAAPAASLLRLTCAALLLASGIDKT